MKWLKIILEFVPFLIGLIQRRPSIDVERERRRVDDAIRNKPREK